MKELLEVLAKALVDNPEAVNVTKREEDHAIILELRFAPEDLWNVIGKHGRIAKAIRTVVKAAASRGESKKVIVDII